VITEEDLIQLFSLLEYLSVVFWGQIQVVQVLGQRKHSPDDRKEKQSGAWKV